MQAHPIEICDELQRLGLRLKPDVTAITPLQQNYGGGMNSGRSREDQIRHNKYVESNFAVDEMQHIGEALDGYPGVFLKLRYPLPSSAAAVSEWAATQQEQEGARASTG